MRKIRLVEVHSELVAGTRGAGMAINTMKITSIKKRSNFFMRFDPVSVQDENQLFFGDPQLPFSKYGQGVYTMLNRVCDTTEEIRKEELFPIVLAGDYSTAAARTICGIKKAGPNLSLGVICIDAHADFRSPYTTPVGNIHGMSLAMLTAEDNEGRESNDVEKTEVLWEQIKQIGGNGSKINPQDVVFIGVRDTEPTENQILEKYGIRNFKTDEVNKKGVMQIAKEALEVLKDCDQIYISFHVDNMDASISTVTPVPNGLSEEQALELNIELIKDKRFCCSEIVEVNPKLDTENKWLM